MAMSGLKDVRDAYLLAKANVVLAAMENNDNFIECQDAVAQLSSCFDEFMELMALGRSRRNAEKTALKNDKRLLVEKALKVLAFQVNTIADGDLSKLLSSGFELSGMKEKSAFPNLVTDVRLRDGKQSGELILGFAKQAKRLIYEYRYAHEKSDKGDYSWSELMLTGSTVRNKVSSIPFKPCYVQVRAINAMGKSAWSEPVSFIGR
jgi:hypothetical protein